jgi:hypothetical protein
MEELAELGIATSRKDTSASGGPGLTIVTDGKDEGDEDD